MLHAFVGSQDVDGVHNACRLVWNAALPLLDQKLSKQVKRTMTSAAQALASVASPLHGLRLQTFHKYDLPSEPCVLHWVYYLGILQALLSSASWAGSAQQCMVGMETQVLCTVTADSCLAWTQRFP